jgi:hypothetical protein
MVPTESAMLIRGGHPVRHPKSSLVIGETEEGSLWLVRAVVWEPGETPMLWLVGAKNEHTWVSFDDVVGGMKV